MKDFIWGTFLTLSYVKWVLKLKILSLFYQLLGYLLMIWNRLVSDKGEMFISMSKTALRLLESKHEEFIPKKQQIYS